MTIPILPTKLFTPLTLNKLVPRPILQEMITRDLSKKITLVSAPAGFGKTTTICICANYWNRPITWLSLDNGDNDKIRFLSYFVAAIKKIFPNFGDQILVSLNLNHSAETKLIFNKLINEILDIQQPFVIVLDDYHLISNPEIHDFLVFMFENQPSNMHLVISSRSDPPWPLARLRVCNQITEVRSKDLRFSRDEVTQFLNEIMNLKLAPDQIEKLEHRTEGWIAGLQMAAISMQNKDDISEFLDGFSGKHRFVMDYLLEEVLSQQSQEIMDFLLKTSILTRLNAELCEFITGGKNSASILEQLEKLNLFLVPLDDQRNWYRYHHLFADLLQKQLQVKLPGLNCELHRSASIWFSKSGFISDAVNHAFKTEDMDFAASQIETHVQTLIKRGEIGITRKWMENLPGDIIHSRPVLCIAQAWTSAKFKTLDLAEDMLAQAEAALSTDFLRNRVLGPKDQQFVNNQISLLQVVISRVRGDSTAQQREIALKALESDQLANDAAAKATLFFRLGLCYLDLGKHDQADHNFSQAIELGKSSGNHYAVHVAGYGQMVIARLRGQLQKITDIGRQNLAFTKERVDHQILDGIDLIMLGGVYYEWNQLDQASDHLTRGLSLVEKIGLTEVIIKGQYYMNCTKIALRTIDQISDLERITERSHPRLTAYAEALMIRAQLLIGERTIDSQYEASIHKWAEKQRLILNEKSTYDWEIQEKLVYSRILCKQYRVQADTETRAKLTDFLQFIFEQRQVLEGLGWTGVLIEVEIVLALVYQVLGKNVEALEALKRGIQLAEPEMFVRIFVDEGEPMRQLLMQTLSAGICKRYSQKLLDSFDSPKIQAHSRIQKPSNDFIDQLSEREMDVLRLLNSHLSVPEIADEILLSPTTIRTHVQNIYGKLGVHRRLEAIQKAKDLKLL